MRRGKKLEVLEELPHEKEPATKALSDVLGSFITTTVSLEDMSFQHCEEAISLPKRATALVMAASPAVPWKGLTCSVC